MNTEVPQRLLYLGRIAHNKGVHNLVKAFPKMHDVYSELTLMIRGQISTGYLESYDKKIRAALSHVSAKDKIQYCPEWYTEEEKVGLLSQADVVIYPSVSSEGFGIGPVEALKLNGIIVASDLFEETGAVTKEVAFIYPRNSTTKLAKSVIEALSLSSEERLIRKKKAKEWALDFTWEKHVKELEKVFYEVCNSLS